MCEAHHATARGSGGMPPRKILKNRWSEIAFESNFVNFSYFIRLYGYSQLRS